MYLSICSYNCCSLRKNIDLIRELTDKNIDIILLQETFVIADDLSILQFIDENYDSIGVGATYSDNAVINLKGRPMGGLCVLWRKNSPFQIKIVSTENDFMVFDIILQNTKITLVNCYIRSDLGDALTYNRYLENLYMLENLLDESDSQNKLVFGDFNACPFYGRSWSSLSEFNNRNNLECFDYLKLPSDSFTYVSFSDSNCKWLDHLMGKLEDNVVIDKMEILYDLIGSDHLPLIAYLNVVEDFSNSDLLSFSKNADTELKEYVNWNSLSDQELKSISINSYNLQGNYYNLNTTSCNDKFCSSDTCRKEISYMYDSIVSSVYSSSIHLAKSYVSKNKFKVIPGWNRRVKDIYNESRIHYKTWLNLGKPRVNLICDLMNNSN